MKTSKYDLWGTWYGGDHTIGTISKDVATCWIKVREFCRDAWAQGQKGQDQFVKKISEVAGDKCVYPVKLTSLRWSSFQRMGSIG